MPRVPRKSYNTSLFHIIVQGINREYIFKKDEYIEQYLKLMKKYKEIQKIEILAYCIMNNHAHLLLETKDSKELYKFMHKINMLYANYYNKKEKRTGYVFRDRYKSEPIYSEEYLWNCMIYIHMNPVEANMTNDMSKYKYSSYNEYLGQRSIITEESMKLVFGSANYIEQFEYIHKKEIEEIFSDIDEDKKDKCKKIIAKFLIGNNTNINSIKNNKNLLKKLTIELKDKNKISYRIIETEIGVGRETLRNL